MGAATTNGHPVLRFSQQTFLLSRLKEWVTAKLTPVRTLAASGVDWSEVHAVKLLGLALGALILFWAVRRMFGGK